MYVLITPQDSYFVEYLIGTLVLSSSLSEAMEFKDIDTATKFKQMLLITCDLKTTISTFIK